MTEPLRRPVLLEQGHELDRDGLTNRRVLLRPCRPRGASPTAEVHEHRFSRGGSVDSVNHFPDDQVMNGAVEQGERGAFPGAGQGTAMMNCPATLDIGR